jgi:hypothetical protein
MAAQGWNFCQGRGLLTSARTPIPDDQGEFYGEGRLDLVPCSHLTCGSCGEVVRHVDGRVIPGSADLAAIYAAPNWRRSTLLSDTDLANRAYGCRCTAANILADSLIETLQELEEDRPLSWSCAGHPTVRGALVLDGVTVGPDTDLDALVLRALDGHPPGALDAPWAAHGAIWVLRLFGRLRGTPLAARVSEAVGRALASDSIGARSEALTFFLQNPFVPGSEALIQTASEQPELFAGITPPDAAPGETLEFQLLRIVGMRQELDLREGRTPDRGGLALLREAALTPGLAAATLPSLSAIDTDWVLANRLAIAQGGKANAQAVSLWVGIHAPAREAETDALLVREGLLDEGDV